MAGTCPSVSSSRSPGTLVAWQSAYCLVSWRWCEVLSVAGSAVAAVAAVLASNAWRTAAEAERFFHRFRDTAFDNHGGDMPVGELVKITGYARGLAIIGPFVHSSRIRPVHNKQQQITVAFMH